MYPRHDGIRMVWNWQGGGQDSNLDGCGGDSCAAFTLPPRGAGMEGWTSRPLPIISFGA
jgi:hypothetical protein